MCRFFEPIKLIGFISGRTERRISFILLLSVIASESLIGMAYLSGAGAIVSGFLVILSTFSLLTLYSALAGDLSSEKSKSGNFGVATGIVNLLMFVTSILITCLQSLHSKFILPFLVFSYSCYSCSPLEDELSAEIRALSPLIML